MKRWGSIVDVLRAALRAGSVRSSLIALGLCCALTQLGGAQQQSLAASPSVPQGSSAQTDSPNLGISSSPGAAQDPFSGSAVSGKATGDVIALTLKDAINRGLKQNLGALLTEQGITSARAQRWRALQEVLPDVTGRIGESEQQINLAAQGIKFPGIPTIIGPFSNFDARAYLTTTVGFSEYESIRASIENLKAANFSYQNALELVVFAVSNAYLQVLTSGANVVNAEAQVNTAQVLVNQAEQMHQAGVTAKIDGLRAAVELQARKQDLVVARNNLEKSKIALARTIGLPLEQQFQLADALQYLPAPVLTQEDAIHHAYQTRLDYRQAEAQVRAAQLNERGAHAERLPSLFVSGNYGDLGISPGSSHGTFVAAGGVQFPIFEEGRIRADIYQAQSNLKQTKDQLADLQGRIDAEVRTAFLDVNAAAERVELAGSTVKLSQEELAEAQDRFAAGVTDNLEVVQAEGSLVNAQNQYVSSLYIHNLAKLSLARAMGEARQNAVSYLGGK